MDYSMPSFSVHHQLPEVAQTHVHGVSDAIQPCHPLSSLSPTAFNLSQHQVAKVLELQRQSFQWKFRTDFLYNWLAGSPFSPRDSQESSPIPQFKTINSLALSILYNPTLTSIHDYWKNHSFDEMDLCWQYPTPVLVPGKSHGWRSLVGCSPWGREESDMTEQLPFHFSLSCIGEGNGNPLQYSCLENPRDGEAWLAAVYGSHRVGHDWSDLAAAAAAF